ncbi:MAG: hypothetical protein AMS24_05455 [Chlamydiae bacterium SM23_39]|nr:MAG: hypothetical protein AMS24_05455 [Chlamydiae bacterium SM23_39]
MKEQDIKEIISFFEKSQLSKFSLKRGDFEIILEKESVAEKVEQEEKVEKEEKIEEFIRSPMVGTFYTSPSPDHDSFVKVGDEVTEDTVVCIIEAMKVMNEVKSEVRGVVKEILCKNAHSVEFGTKLFKIEPK